MFFRCFKMIRNDQDQLIKENGIIAAKISSFQITKFALYTHFQNDQTFRFKHCYLMRGDCQNDWSNLVSHFRPIIFCLEFKTFLLRNLRFYSFNAQSCSCHFYHIFFSPKHIFATNIKSEKYRFKLSLILSMRQ